MDVPKAFVEEIDFEELQFLEVVGRGAFGVVSRARWRNIDVAVKLIETESEKKAFITELKQLSRVSHPNIVKLYGSCSKQPVCLVMEYAEGGSLYNVLHGSGPQPEYTAAHAMSWMLQCAKGVEYLHSMKPKPLIHRDLKPPNLLLIMGGTVLKICDFGTACDAATHMTNNKGSAAWMAPEVFEGNNYSEKCDVFSWGIILWEVITRKKPFDDIGGPAFRIMWAVHNGTRPPLIKNLPKPLEILMTRCWSQNAVERPPMAEVVRIMSHLNKFFKGGDESLMYPNTPVGGPNLSGTSVMDTPPASNQSQTPPSDYSRGNTIRDTVRRALALQGEPVHVKATTPCAKPVVVEDNKPQGTSAPASLAASHESLDKGSRSSTPSFDMVNKRYSADLSKLQEMDILVHGARMTPAENKPGPARGHRRTGSYGNSPVTSSIDISNAVMTSPNSSTAPAVMHHSTTAPASMGNLVKEQECHMSWTPGSTVNIMPTGLDNQALNLAFIAMDHQLQPLAPSPANPDSMAIFDHHCKLAQEYLRVQTEIALLTQRKHELQRDLEQDEQLQQNSLRFKEEYGQLAIENESLMLLHKNLDKQVRIIREQQQKRYGAA